MPLLKILKEGQLIHQIELQKGREYILGRSSNCDFVLDASRGISRQHLKIYFDGVWKVDALSKYKELYHEGVQKDQIDLSTISRFSVPPYEFLFEQEKISVSQPVTDTGSHSLSDRTQVGSLQVTAFLIASSGAGAPARIFQLEGTSWIAGRDTSCALFIDDSKFSRHHFEMSYQAGLYHVKDLGSSNGTRLNGVLISDSEWTQIVSGDMLSVADWNLQFELRDSNFDDQLRELPAEFRSPVVYQSSGGDLPSVTYPSGAPAPAPFLGPPIGVVSSAPDSSEKKTNWVRIAIMAVLVIGGLGYFAMPGSKNQDLAPTKRELSAFERLKPEQQSYVRDTYRAADRLFKEGRYELARQEISKIHALVPFFEESKNLEKLADVAIQTLIEQKKAAEREKEQAEMEEKIQATVARCDKLIDSNVQRQKIDDCLSPIIVLNPDHPAILALRSKVDKVLNDLSVKEQLQAEYRSMVQKQKGLFAAAEKIQKEGNAIEAIKAYSRVVASRLPDPNGLKDKAQREIASIQQKIAVDQAKYEGEAESAFKSGDFKTAVLKIKKALSYNPENEVLIGRMNSMLGELKKQMQTLYQEGVLEESVGEVETAKAKWKKIINTSLPEEDYYKKAKIKLKKYGIE